VDVEPPTLQLDDVPLIAAANGLADDGRDDSDAIPWLECREYRADRDGFDARIGRRRADDGVTRADVSRRGEPVGCLGDERGYLGRRNVAGSQGQREQKENGAHKLDRL